MKMNLDKPFYSPKELVPMAGVPVSAILDRIRNGQLYAVTLSPGTYRIPVRSVLKWPKPESIFPPAITNWPDVDFDITDADREPDFSGR